METIGIWQSILILIAIIILRVALIALIDILRSEFTGNAKIVWILIVLLANVLGAILCLIIGRKQKVKN